MVCYLIYFFILATIAVRLIPDFSDGGFFRHNVLFSSLISFSLALFLLSKYATYKWLILIAIPLVVFFLELFYGFPYSLYLWYLFLIQFIIVAVSLYIAVRFPLRFNYVNGVIISILILGLIIFWQVWIIKYREYSNLYKGISEYSYDNNRLVFLQERHTHMWRRNSKGVAWLEVWSFKDNNLVYDDRRTKYLNKNISDFLKTDRLYTHSFMVKGDFVVGFYDNLIRTINLDTMKQVSEKKVSSGVLLDIGNDYFIGKTLETDNELEVVHLFSGETAQSIPVKSPEFIRLSFPYIFIISDIRDKNSYEFKLYDIKERRFVQTRIFKHNEVFPVVKYEDEYGIVLHSKKYDYTYYKIDANTGQIDFESPHFILNDEGSLIAGSLRYLYFMNGLRKITLFDRNTYEKRTIDLMQVLNKKEPFAGEFQLQFAKINQDSLQFIVWDFGEMSAWCFIPDIPSFNVEDDNNIFIKKIPYCVDGDTLLLTSLQYSKWNEEQHIKDIKLGKLSLAWYSDYNQIINFWTEGSTLKRLPQRNKYKPYNYFQRLYEILDSFIYFIKADDGRWLQF